MGPWFKLLLRFENAVLSKLELYRWFRLVIKMLWQMSISWMMNLKIEKWTASQVFYFLNYTTRLITLRLIKLQGTGWSWQGSQQRRWLLSWRSFWFHRLFQQRTCRSSYVDSTSRYEPKRQKQYQLKIWASVQLC